MGGHSCGPAHPADAPTRQGAAASARRFVQEGSAIPVSSQSASSPRPADAPTQQGSPVPIDQHRPFVLVELFAGLCSASFACERLGIKPTAAFASEIDEDAITVMTANFPITRPLGSVEDLAGDLIDQLAAQYPDAVWAVCGGPPCVGVSMLNRKRKGAYA